MENLGKLEKAKVRFAPSPSGEIHLGNLRAALVNFLYAKHTNGTFVLRIEDTDASTALQENVIKIVNTLKFYGITYDYGPDKTGPDAPYFQSERTNLYLEYLKTFEENNFIYRCFCTKEDLESEREIKVKLKHPPRYSRKCMAMPMPRVLEKIAFGMPFVWRLRLNHDQVVTFNDVGKGEMCLKMSNFSDPAITRPDGTFTFLFANFVDDVAMKITHVVRGEDHLSNTATQVFMYNCLMLKTPVFAHLPIILNEAGQKLSKRERHFTAQSLLDDGFLPEVVCDHLVRMGNFNDSKPKSMEDLVQEFSLAQACSSANLRHDTNQLMWLSKEHMKAAKVERILHVIEKNQVLSALLAKVNFDNHEKLVASLEILKGEFGTIVDLLNCLIELTSERTVDLAKIAQICPADNLALILEFLVAFDQAQGFDVNYNSLLKGKVEKPIVMKTLRTICTGKPEGVSIEKTLKIYGIDRLIKVSKGILPA